MDHNSQRYKPANVTAVIEKLRGLFDPVALMGWIDKRTRAGDNPGPDAWTYTLEFLGRYDLADKIGDVTRAFGKVGVSDEIDASLWIAEHLDRIP